MFIDYCRYILSKESDHTETSYQREGRRLCSKEEFYIDLDMALKLRRKAIGVKGGFDPDIFLFEVLQYFFSESKLLSGRLAEPDLYEAIQNEWKKLQEIIEKWEKNEFCYYEGMYEELFEIISWYMILLENVRISTMENDEAVHFHTTDIDIESLEMQVRNNNKTKIGKLRVPVPKDFIKNIKKPKEVSIQDVDTALYYFVFILHATYTRNEELKSGVGYGW